MTNRCHRRNIVDQTVIAGITSPNQPFEAIVAELVIIPTEVVPSHLVYHDTYYELRTLIKFSFCLCTYRAAEQQKQTYPFHAAKVQLFPQSAKYLRKKTVRQMFLGISVG
jgi:hypothetical protein